MSEQKLEISDVKITIVATLSKDFNVSVDVKCEGDQAICTVLTGVVKPFLDVLSGAFRSIPSAISLLTQYLSKLESKND